MLKNRKILVGVLSGIFLILALAFLPPRMIPSREVPTLGLPPEGYIRGTVEGFRILPSGGVVFLGGDGSEKVLPIYIGMDQAHTLARVLDNLTTERPMTHDLIEEVFEGSGIELVYISVDRLEEGTYYATIVLDDEGEIRIDARPSDSIILALKMGAPIYVNKDLIDEGGIAPEHAGIYREGLAQI
ncbi:MAG: bifunctional nuclease family protein [Candidatus Hydrothermarchaeales archaeon]